MSHSTNKKLLATGAVMVGLSAFVPNPFMTGEALAQMTASTTLDMSATVVNPLSIAEINSLNWGVFAINGGGKFAISASGVQNVLPADGQVVSAGTAGKVKIGVPQNAVFTLSVTKYGTGNNIKMRRTTAPTTATSSKKTLLVTEIYVKGTAKVSKSAGALTDTMNLATPSLTNLKITHASNFGYFNWGGRLQFGGTAAQNEGAYTGTFSFFTTL